MDRNTQIGAGLGGAALGLGLVIIAWQVGKRFTHTEHVEAEHPSAAASAHGTRERAKPDVGTVKRADEAPASTAAPEAAPSQPAPDPGPKTLAEAIQRMGLDDSVDALDPGSVRLAIWAGSHSTWADIAPRLGETTFGRVMKDSEAERGKRACFSGSLIEISTQRVDGTAYYAGGLMTGGMDPVRFIAFGSSGDLEGSSSARICGVVTGRYSYSNAGGGTTHAANVVGMFDLPENRKRKASM